MIAIWESKQAGLLSKAHILNNITSGIVVGIVALPLGMAFAIASGAKPEQGIYTAIIAGAISALLGGSRVQISGPTGAFIVILAGITSQYGIAGLQIATLMAGLMLVIMGVARFGNVIKYIPLPVIVGFTTGIAVLIWVGQWKDFFGLPPVAGAHFHEKLFALFQTLPSLDIKTTLLAIFTLCVLIASPYFFKRAPAPLIGMIAATSLQYFYQFEGVETIGSASGGCLNVGVGCGRQRQIVSEVRRSRTCDIGLTARSSCGSAVGDRDLRSIARLRTVVGCYYRCRGAVPVALEIFQIGSRSGK